MKKDWVAWLIENGGNGSELRYRTMEQGLPTWTTDPYKALHFCRREDAERFAEEDPDAWRITDHLFYGDDTVKEMDEANATDTKMDKLLEWLSSEEGMETVKRNQEKSDVILKKIQEARIVSPEKMREQFTI